MSAIITSYENEKIANGLPSAGYKVAMVIPSIVGHDPNERNGYIAVRRNKKGANAETVRKEIENCIKSLGIESDEEIEATFDGLNDAKKVLIETFKERLISTK